MKEFIQSEYEVFKHKEAKFIEILDLWREELQEYANSGKAKPTYINRQNNRMKSAHDYIRSIEDLLNAFAVLSELVGADMERLEVLERENRHLRAKFWANFALLRQYRPDASQWTPYVKESDFRNFPMPPL